MNQRKSVAMVLGAGALWGLISLFARGLSACGLGALQTVCYRNLLAALLLGVFLAVRQPKLLKIQLRDCWMFVGTGIISILLFNFCYFFTLDHVSVAVASLLLYTSPVFVTVLAFLLFHEPFTARKGVALCLTVLGCACVTGVFSQAQAVPVLYVITGLGSGLFYGLYSIFGKAALKKYPTETVTFYTFVFAAVATLPVSLRACVIVTAQHPQALLLGLGFAFLCTVLPFQLYTRGLAGVTAGQAAIFATVEPLVGTLVGIFVFGDTMSFWTVAGIALVLLSIWLMNRPAGQREICHE